MTLAPFTEFVEHPTDDEVGSGMELAPKANGHIVHTQILRNEPLILWLKQKVHDGDGHETEVSQVAFVSLAIEMQAVGYGVDAELGDVDLATEQIWELIGGVLPTDATIDRCSISMAIDNDRAHVNSVALRGYEARALLPICTNEEEDPH